MLSNTKTYEESTHKERLLKEQTVILAEIAELQAYYDRQMNFLKQDLAEIEGGLKTF